MRRSRLVLSLVGVAAALALVAAACGGDDGGGEGETPIANVGGAAGAAGVPPETFQVSEVVSGVGGVPVPSGVVGVVAGSSQQTGIWVTGRGEVAVTPDLALISLGVEARADTVAEAQGQASRSMDAVVSVLRSNGVAERDIQTRVFNIQPEFTFEETVVNGRRSGKQVLVGFRVTNTVAVKVRDLDAVGTIVDQVAEAGGDLTRVNSISFTREDLEAAQTEAREEAVLDALAKGQQFATLTGVTLGRLVFISESGGGVPVVKDFAVRTLAEAAPAPTTPISGGELDVQVFVQAVFAIQ